MSVRRRQKALTDMNISDFSASACSLYSNCDGSCVAVAAVTVTAVAVAAVAVAAVAVTAVTVTAVVVTAVAVTSVAVTSVAVAGGPQNCATKV